jgi:MYXO-CTERM domain-containing protein
VNYWSSEPLFSENTVRFATVGRGVWDFRLDPQGQGCFATRDDDLDGVACELDCDDADDTVFPGSGEDACDGVDADCDGTPEVDLDGDGVYDCEDCDDAEPLAFPGNAEVECDGVDNDCDGQEVCPPAPADDPGKGGCGCDGSGSGSALGLLALAALLRRQPPKRRAQKLFFFGGSSGAGGVRA